MQPCARDASVDLYCKSDWRIIHKFMVITFGGNNSGENESIRIVRGNACICLKRAGLLVQMVSFAHLCFSHKCVFRRSDRSVSGFHGYLDG